MPDKAKRPEKTPQPSANPPVQDSSQAEGDQPMVMDAANRHVGPTLEAGGNFSDVLGTSLPVAGSEAAGGDALDSVEVRYMGASRPETPVPGQGGRTEALRTRLPGDTSSDPHTDVGPDNATTARAHVDEDEPRRRAVR